MRVYIAGKITGEDLEICKEKFKSYSKLAKHKFPNAKIINPFEINKDIIPNGTYSEYFSNDMKEFVFCDVICFIPDWKESSGALVEYQIAEKMGLQIVFL